MTDTTSTLGQDGKPFLTDSAPTIHRAPRLGSTAPSNTPSEATDPRSASRISAALSPITNGPQYVYRRLCDRDSDLGPYVAASGLALLSTGAAASLGAPTHWQTNLASVPTVVWAGKRFAQSWIGPRPPKSAVSEEEWTKSRLRASVIWANADLSHFAAIAMANAGSQYAPVLGLASGLAACAIVAVFPTKMTSTQSGREERVSSVEEDEKGSEPGEERKEEKSARGD